MTDSKCKLPYDKGFMSGKLRVVKCTVLSDILQGVMYSNETTSAELTDLQLFPISKTSSIIRIKTNKSATLYEKEN